MSGHSKWSTIKHKKAITDQRRGARFTKLAREIIVAAREGGPDPEMNFRLRLAINNARASNMPNDNIDRAIKKGAGLDGSGEQLHEVMYEGYAPGGAAIMVQALTDNRNRTASEVRSRFTKAGGNLAESGAVAWGFDNKGTITVTLESGAAEDLALEAADAGAEDFSIDGNTIEFTVSRTDLARLRTFLDGRDGVTVDQAEFAMVPKNQVQLDTPRAQQALRLLEALEELDDVQKVYTNADFPNEVLAAASG
ncbi:MAG: YebC/PmpR family DNA-binding transcriptional regulator [SAR202 cluster bacterium]|nr:YebC/PmpR family DNA-binding transcriptional regulator [SAR202 cluster bacterium]